jgi:hypothetical protein
MAIMIGGTGLIVGLEVEAPPRGTEPPTSEKNIADTYQTATHSFGELASTKRNSFLWQVMADGAYPACTCSASGS